MDETTGNLIPNPSHLARLLDGCRQHDRYSQSEVYKLFYRYALTVAQGYSGSVDEAREVVNDAFLRAFTKIHLYDPSMPFKPWLNRVVVHAAIDHYRRYQAKQPQTLEVQEHLLNASNDSTILEKIAVEDLRKAVQKLPPAYRTVLNLFAIEGYEHNEIAKMLGIAEGTSKSNLFKARLRLREILTKLEPKKT